MRFLAALPWFAWLLSKIGKEVWTYLNPYWAIKHWYWRQREKLTVRLISDYFGGNTKLYVHKTDRSPAYYVVLPVSHWLAVEAALVDMTDSDPCEYDHHDLCQAHSLHERPCPHERAKVLLVEDWSHDHIEG